MAKHDSASRLIPESLRKIGKKVSDTLGMGQVSRQLAGAAGKGTPVSGGESQKYQRSQTGVAFKKRQEEARKKSRQGSRRKSGR